MTISSKRAEYAALTAFILSSIFFGTTFLLGRWSGSLAVFVVSWQILSAALIWLVLLIQFHQRSLAHREKLDMAQLTDSGRDGTIFQTEAEQSQIFAAARKRLTLLEKWFIPIFAALIAVYQLVLGLLLFRLVSTQVVGEINQPLINAVYMAAIAFVSFLISRYTIGMSGETEWKPLKAGASYMHAYALVCFAVAVGLALVQFKIDMVLVIIRYLVPVLLIVLGAESILNIILNIYRPRLPGRYSRAAYDSGLLALISQPTSVFRTAATALDYQFGFKVSQTWFYKLLEKAIVPLILFSSVTLYLLSCFVVIPADSQAVIERFGRPIAAGKSAIIGAGLHFKWPWPIDIAYKYPTKKIQQISIGFVPQADPAKRQKILLWGQEHYEKEYNLLVATEAESTYGKAGAVPVSLVRAAVPVQYRINDLYAFMYNHKDSEKILEAICYRELVRFAASARIEPRTNPDDSDLDDSILGAGRAAAAATLVQRIQTAADDAGLGVEIVFLGLQGVHPPPEVAEDYQQVIAAAQKKQALVLMAHAGRNSGLSLLAGSVEKANKLYSLAAQYQNATNKGDEPEILDAAEKLDNAFEQARGDIFAELSRARSYAFEKSTLARATGQRFADQFKAYTAAGEIYKHRQRLTMLEDALAQIRKYVVVADANDEQVFIIDVKDKLTPSLYELGGFEEEEKKK